MHDFIFLFLAPQVVIILVSVIVGIILWERSARKRVEQELRATRKSLKEVCEACMSENNNIRAKIAYEVYFGKAVNHTGDGFIDGEE